MALLTRLFTFAPSTVIVSDQVNQEFNQLVNILNGTSTNKDALIKFNDATNFAFRVDQVGAGPIQQWLNNGTEKASIRNNGALRINSTQTFDAASIGVNNDANNLAGTALVAVLQNTSASQKGLRIAMEGATSGGLGAMEVTKFDGAAVQPYFKVNMNGEVRTAAGYSSTIANV